MPIDTDTGSYRLVSSQPIQQQQVASSNGNEHSKKSLAIDQDFIGASNNNNNNVNQLDLFIENIQAGHSTGEYKCLASNSEGSVEAKSQVILAIPAVITTVPRNQTRLEGEKMELMCQAKGLPSNITYRWFFNDKPIQQLKWFESRSTIRRDGTLIIHSIHRDDQGEYKCQATNGLMHNIMQQSSKNNNNRPSTTTSKTTTTTTAQQKESVPIYAEASAHLHVEYPARITYSPQVQYLPMGMSGIIRCYYQAAPQVEFFTWTLNNQQFDPNLDSNVERLLNGSLLIRQVTKQYEGKYRCTPFNKHGSAGSSAAMEIRVEEPPYFDLKPADFYKATINGHIKIPCDGHGSPKPTVTWRKVITTTTASSSSSNRTNYASQQQQPAALKRNKLFLVASSGNGDGLLVVDEAAGDEPNEEHHLYATMKTPIDNNDYSTMNNKQMSVDSTEAAYNVTPTNSNDNFISGDQEQENLQQQQQLNEEQSVIISYSKMPSDRSEYKQSHLFLSGLRKEDHGRYECVIENEIATLIAPTMLYIEGKFHFINLFIYNFFLIHNLSNSLLTKIL